MAEPGQQARRVLAERRDPGHRRDRHPARRYPRPGQGRGKLIGTTGQLQFFDFENDLAAADRQRHLNTDPVSDRSTTCSQQVAGPGEKGAPRAYYLFGPKTKTRTVNGKNDEDDDQARDPAVRSEARKQLLGPYGGKVPKGTDGPDGAGGHDSSSTAPSRPATRPSEAVAERRLLVPRSSTAAGTDRPEITGDELEESGIQADIGQDGQPERDAQFTGHGSSQFKKITKDEYDRGRSEADFNGKLGRRCNQRTRSTTRSCSTGSSSRRRSSTTRARSSRTGSPAAREIVGAWRLDRRRRRTSRSSSRAARSRTRSSRSTETRRLGDAR